MCADGQCDIRKNMALTQHVLERRDSPSRRCIGQEVLQTCRTGK